MPPLFFRRPDSQHLFTGVNEQFHKRDLSELLDTYTVEADSLRGKRNARCAGSMKELGSDDLKAPQIKLAGLCFDADCFQVSGRFADAQGGLLIVCGVKSGPTRIHSDKPAHRTIYYCVELWQNASATVFCVAEQLLYRKIVLWSDNRFVMVFRKIAETISAILPGLMIQIIGSESFSRLDSSAMTLISQDLEDAARRPHRIPLFRPAA